MTCGLRDTQSMANPVKSIRVGCRSFAISGLSEGEPDFASVTDSFEPAFSGRKGRRKSPVDLSSWHAAGSSFAFLAAVRITTQNI